MFNRKSFLIGVAAALGATLFAGCGGSGGSGGDSLVRFVNAVPGGQTVDAYLDNTLAKAGIAPLSSTTEVQVPSGTRQIRVTSAGNGATNLIASNVSLSNASYSYVVYGVPGTLQTLLLQDDTSGVNNNNVRYTVVHAAPGAGAVDVYVTTPTADLTTAAPTVSNLTAGNFQTIGGTPSGSYRVRVTPTGTKNVVIDSGAAGVTLAPGSVYNIYATQAGTVAAPALPLVQFIK